MCQKCVAIYKCPGCLRRTCSVPCVRQHKEKFGCSGKRKRTDFIATSDFNNTLLLDDYYFLKEATDQVVDSRKKQKQLGSVNTRANKYKRPMKRSLQLLVEGAKKRGFELCLMETHMSRRKNNRSFYRVKDDHFFWSVQCIFHNCDKQSDDDDDKKDKGSSEMVFLKRVDEQTSFGDLIQNALKHAEQSVDHTYPVLALCKDFTQPQDRFHVIEDHTHSLKVVLESALEHGKLIEHPIIHCFRSRDDFDLIN